MLSDSNIFAVDWGNWVSAREAIKLMDINQPEIYGVRRNYKLVTYSVCGRTLYYRPDVERAAAEIATMRAKRVSKVEAASKSD